MSADQKMLQRSWDDLQTIRMPREGEWRQIAELYAPRKTFDMNPRLRELGLRRVTTSLGPSVLGRSAGLFMAYLIDPTRPFIGPNVDRGMVTSGRRLQLDSDARDYLDTVQWAMFDRMMLPQSAYLSSTSRLALELFGFGTGIRWTGRKRGFGPRYQHRPLRNCWIAENDEGEVDTLYFRWTSPAWRVVQRYPEAAKISKIAELAGDERRCQEHITLVHAVEPRMYGRAGAVATNKPFQSVTFAPDHMGILEESGFDSFPYSVARLDVEEGSCYGTGLGWKAAPDVLAYNWFQQQVEMAVGLRVNPPRMKPARMFAKPLDLRPGANNTYDQAGLGFSSAKDAIQRLDIAGDPAIGVQWMQMIEKRVQEIFYVDWMSLGDGVQKTAEEIRERRDLRVRAMTAMVPSVDRDLIGRDADRTLECMVEEDQLPPAPKSIAGVEVDWDYKGPLALMQQRGQVDAIGMLLDLTIKSAQLDQTAPMALNVIEGIRAAGEALGVPLGVMRGREDVDKQLAEAAKRAQAQQDLAEANAGATAMRDGAQGVASLAGASGAGGGDQAQNPGSAGGVAQAPANVNVGAFPMAA